MVSVVESRLNENFIHPKGVGLGTTGSNTGDGQEGKVDASIHICERYNFGIGAAQDQIVDNLNAMRLLVPAANANARGRDRCESIHCLDTMYHIHSSAMQFHYAAFRGRISMALAYANALGYLGRVRMEKLI